jgi:hypothetical protein
LGVVQVELAVLEELQFSVWLADKTAEMAA